MHHLERRVDVLRAEINTMQGAMAANRTTVQDVRRALEANDAAHREAIARAEERLKALERAKP